MIPAIIASIDADEGECEEEGRKSPDGGKFKLWQVEPHLWEAKKSSIPFGPISVRPKCCTFILLKAGSLKVYRPDLTQP